MKKWLLILMFVFQSAVCLADGVTYYNFLYKVEENDTFASILRSFVKDDAIINKDTPLVRKIVNNNPKIKSWSKLHPGTVLSLFIPSNLIDTKKYNAIKKNEDAFNDQTKKAIAAKLAGPEGFKAAFYYITAWGSFTQTAPSGLTINYNQTSLATFGGQFTYYLKNSPYSYYAGLHYAMFSPAETTLPPNQVDIPSEIAGSFYGQYLWKKNRLTWIGGLDYETSSVFNIDGIEEIGEVKLDKLTTIYATAGVSHVVNVFNEPLYLKFTLSKSVAVNTTAGYTPIIATEAEKYSSMKALLYVNYKFTNKLFLHSMFRYYKMSGPSEISSTHIGVGLGYILF